MIDVLQAAAAIGDEICEGAVWHGDRCTWVAPAIQEIPRERPRLIFAPLGPTLYDGTAGIALFLAELWTMSGRQEHRRTALGAIRHAVARSGTEGRAGLHGGRTGTALAARRVAIATDREDLLGAIPALVAEPSEMAQETDLLAGIAGSALGLMALGPLAGANLLDRVERLGDEIVVRAEAVGPHRSWPTGRPQDRIANLLGVSHGASGIALALAEVGAATGRSDLLDVARAGFSYERALFDPKEKNWPDLRALTRSAAVGPSFMTAWCHGAGGIAAARLRAYEILGDDELRSEAVMALATTAQAARDNLDADGADFCLCHGLAGNADVLLTGARSLPEEGATWRQIAVDVAAAGIERYHARGVAWPCGRGAGPTPSLMLGLAGIGLFLLRLGNVGIASPLAIALPVSAREPEYRSTSEEVAIVQ